LRLFKIITLALGLMLLGTALELYLLGHYEDSEQLLPILCIGLVLLAALALWMKPVKKLRQFMRLILLLTGLSGAYGCYLHLNANYEFELEMTPTADTWYLLTESFTGALPVLAPASMMVLALIGYAYLILIKHPK